MRKLLSFAVILSLLLTFAFPVAQAGTITQKVQAAINKIDFITAGEFVTSLLLGAKVKPNGIVDYWGKAVQMGLIPGEVKKDKPLTRAQASYIVWKLINAVPELKAKNIPVSVRRVPPTEAFMRGICFFGGPYSEDSSFGIRGHDLTDFIQGYQLLILEYKYADGTTQIKYVWDRYKGVSLAPGTYKSINEPFKKILAEFKQKYPNKVVYAPRPYQKGWMFTIDPVRDGDLKYAWYLSIGKDFESRINEIRVQKGYPLSRKDFTMMMLGYYQNKQQMFKGYYGTYNIKEHPYFNMYFEDYLINYPRKYPTDHTRFAYYCKDYYQIPQLYREPMLRLADLGIITPDQSALYIGVYYFNAGKTLTRAEAAQMIARVFDKSKRDVLDEVKVRQYRYWIPENKIGTGQIVEYDVSKKKFEASKFSVDEIGIGMLPSQTQAIYRIEEPKALGFARAMMLTYPKEYYWWNFDGRDLGLATFSCNDVITEVSPYDEADVEALVEWDGAEALNFVPLAYRDEFKKDIQKYTAKVLLSKRISLIKQYGNVYVYYDYLIGSMTEVRFVFYSVKPKMYSKGTVFLVAKPNPKYTQ